MRTKAQAEIAVEISVNDRAPKPWRSEQPRTVHMLGTVASAFKQLFAAERYGVHIREIKPDVLARFDQAGIPYEVFAAPKRGTAERKAWVRLSFPDFLTPRIVAEVN